MEYFSEMIILPFFFVERGIIKQNNLNNLIIQNMQKLISARREQRAALKRKRLIRCGRAQ